MLRPLLMFIGGLLLLCGSVHAQQTSPGEFTRQRIANVHYSLSRQFVINSQFQTGWLPSAGVSSSLVRLEPNFLAVTCERIKRSLMKELGVSTDQWRGKIYLELRPARNLGETIQVTSIRSNNSWDYRVQLPDTLERSRLVSTIVELLLLEMANRNATDHSAEIPAWLAQGLTQQIITSSQVDPILQPPTEMEFGVNISRTNRSERWANPLARAHEILSNQPPLPLEQLSWPADGQFTGEAGEAYRSSAQLFVCELMNLPDGRACLRAFLAELPQHLNWQISFLKTFHNHFATQLDLEKWWALRLLNFTGRDLSRIWSVDESWRKLDEIIHSPVQVRTAANEMPMRTQVALQTIIQDWDFPRQSTLFQSKIQQLLLLRACVAQNLIPLVDGYRQAIETYMKNRDKAGFGRLAQGLSTPGLDAIAAQSIRELNGWDARLEQLRPQPGSVTEARNKTAASVANH
ncbi:MAG: hypothetical protein JWR19_2892 [Pedosphaera sp.]|nr:hypothetical protein [Pedosphaera sp.]